MTDSPPSPSATGVGRVHGTSRHEPFDRWFRYPAGFASDYVSALFKTIGLQEGTVVDCFAGSGVTGTAARSNGLSFRGIEAHPLIAEVASLKLAASCSPLELQDAAKQIGSIAKQGILSLPDGFDLHETDLVRRSFDVETLSVLVSLRDAISNIQGNAEAYLKWALLATLRDVAAVKVGWPYQCPAIARRARFGSAEARFQARVQMMADDLGTLEARSFDGTVVTGDSRDKAVWVGIEADGCVSSPPYLNNFDYADATRLELYFLGEIRSWKAMTDKVRREMITATTQQSSREEQRKSELAIQEMGTVGEEILALKSLLASERTRRGRGAKQYDQVVAPYFHAMSLILENLYPALSTGSKVAWLIGDSAPYGIYVDTPTITASLAGRAGFSAISDTAVRHRGQRWAGSPGRHTHPLTERVVVLQKD